jgi:epoxyqueuosine reductase
VPAVLLTTRRVPDPDDLVAVGRAHGLDAVGVAPATPFATTRRHLEARKAAGLHGGMQFTYRSPSRSCDPGLAVRDARALVVGARSYRRSLPARDEGTSGAESAEAPTQAGGPRPVGRVARYAWEDHYFELRTALTAVADRIRLLGWRARVVADDNALVDREAAYRAGLGWYGKNANLLLPGQGSWFVLGSVITDAPVATTGPRVEDGCGPCTRCLDGCPTGAIVRPGVVDARRCLAWLLQIDGPFPLEYREALGDRLYGCDDCQEVCPPNRRLDRLTSEGPVPASAASGRASLSVVAPVSSSAQVTVDVLDLLAASDDELLGRYGRWYIPRRQPRYLRRNALVVLGNVADPADGRVAAALGRALVSGDPIVRGHAVWAARRLGRDDLLVAAGLGTADGPDPDADPDPLVRAELAAPVRRR